MALRNPVKITTLKILTVQQYVKMVTLLLKKFAEGDEIPFTIMLKHVYKGLDKNRSEKMPLFLFGTPADGTNKWKNYCDAIVKQDSDALVRGTCIMQEGKAIKMNIQKTKGASKIPRKKLEYLNALLKKLGDYSMVTDTPKPQRPRPQNVVAGAVAGTGTKTPRKPTEEELQEHIQKRRDEAQQMSESIDIIGDIVNDSIGDVTSNIGDGATSQDDVNAMKDLVEQFKLFESLYEETGGQVSEMYEPAHQKLLEKKRQIYKMSKLAKALALSQSDRATLKLANAYYSYINSDDEPSRDEKISEFRPIFEDIVAFTKETGMKQEFALKIASYLIKRRGPEKFRVEAIQIVALQMES